MRDHTPPTHLIGFFERLPTLGAPFHAGRRSLERGGALKASFAELAVAVVAFVREAALGEILLVGGIPTNKVLALTAVHRARVAAWLTTMAALKLAIGGTVRDVNGRMAISTCGLFAAGAFLPSVGLADGFVTVAADTLAGDAVTAAEDGSNGGGFT